MKRTDHDVSLRAGGVPEHFNFAWHRPEAHRGWAHCGVDVSWSDYPGGTGAMVEALTAGRIDVAPVLTEGAIAAAAQGAPIRVISTWVDSSLVWGVHVAANHAAQSIQDLRDSVFAISRIGSGSHLMAEVMAHARGWPGLDYEVVRNLEGARKALSSGQAVGFLWEKYTTKPLVDSGEWKRLGEVATPWPSFVIVASVEAIQAHRDALEALLQGLQDTLAAVTPDDARRFISERYDLPPADVAAWYAQTRWRCNWWRPAPALAPAIDALVTAGVLASAPDAASLCWSS